jgi:hypothetical protein
MLVEVLQRTWKAIAAFAVLIMLVVARSGIGGGLAASVGAGAGAIGDKFQLTSEERAVYRTCRGKLARYYLKAGGDMSYFCGCFAKEATEHLNEAHKARAVTYLVAIVSDRRVPARTWRFFPSESYSGHASDADAVGRSVIRNTTDCGERANNVKAGTGRS